MSTGLPWSAASSASDSRSRTMETEYFFMCTLYTGPPGGRLFPGDLHAEEMQEHLTRRLVLRIRLRAADVEIDLLRRRVGFAAGQLLPRQRVIDAECLPVAQALRDHEVHLVVLIKRLAIQCGMSVSPAGEKADRLR